MPIQQPRRKSRSDCAVLYVGEVIIEKSFQDEYNLSVVVADYRPEIYTRDKPLFIVAHRGKL